MATDTGIDIDSDTDSDPPRTRPRNCDPNRPDRNKNCSAGRTKCRADCSSWERNCSADSDCCLPLQAGCRCAENCGRVEAHSAGERWADPRFADAAGSAARDDLYSGLAAAVAIADAAVAIDAEADDRDGFARAQLQPAAHKRAL